MATIGFEEKLWQAADKLRGSMDAAKYKNVALGIIFLKYVSDSFEEKYEELKNDDLADEEDKDEYLAENIFWVPKKHVSSILTIILRNQKLVKLLIKQ